MNWTDYLRRQFSYDDWANHEVLRAIRNQGGDEARSVQLMSHIVAAERLWWERLKQVPQSIAVWPSFDLATCETQATEMAGLWREYLDCEGDLSRSIAYKNSKAEAWTSTVIDVLTHVILHSAYHRGQIAGHMRAAGLTPAYTDFIHGIRQGLVE